MINKNDEEYINVVKDIIKLNKLKPSRSINIYYAMNKNLELDLSYNKLPLSTFKYVSIKNVIIELLWFISGSTNYNDLKKQNVNIWNKYDKNYQNKVKIYYDIDGDLGPVYGFQWRYFGAKYINCNTNYKGQGVDQLQTLIDQLINDPYNRRHVLCAWNSLDIKKMLLPPCHCMVIFEVFEKKLSSHLIMRSSDVCLGLPYNIASYSLLTHMIAQICGYTADKLYITLSNAHIYETHLENIKKEINHKLYKSSKIKLNSEIKNIDDFKLNDFELIDYKYTKSPYKYILYE